MLARRLVLAVVSVALVAAVPVGAAAADPAADQTSESLIKYYRKKNNLPPTQPIAVKDVKEAPIKGAKQGVLEVGTQKVTFVASPDLRYVVFGDIDDITIDPSKAVMEKISLKGEPFKGGKDAKVTIVEYSDFQCPFCTKGYQTIENEVLKQYGDKVKFYYKHLPLGFHPWAEPAAIAYECIKQQDPDAAWIAYKGFFENQKDMNPTNVKEKGIAFVADKKIDKAKFDKCYDNKETLTKVNADKQEAAALGISGTPSFVINGRHVKGAQPADRFKAVIDDELSTAK